MIDKTLARKRGVAWSMTCALVTLSGMALTGCGGEGNMTSAPPVPGEPTQALFAFYTDGGQNHVARIDPVTLQVLETNHVPFGAAGGKQKSYFYEDRYVWVAQGANVYGLNPDTLEPVLGRGGPFIQANRSGEVGLAQVNNVGVSSAAISAQSIVYDSEIASLLQKTSWTDEELSRVDICALHHEMSRAAQMMIMGGNVMPMDHLSADDVLFHNMGYAPVGNETSPDGKLVMYGVRQGDHVLFLDVDPDSDTFGLPVRFVHSRHGTVKDHNNDVVGTFTSAYTASGGTAPGNLRYNRAAQGVASETDPETYIEPCDSTMLRNHQGVAWTWTVDVDGDTITGVNVDTINTDSPEVYNIPVTVVRKRNLNGPATAGPWMASLVNRNTGPNEFLFFVEYEGENSEGVWNVTNAGSAFEVQRMYNTLRDVVDDDTITTFVPNQLYEVTISYATTGGASTVVLYRYVTLPGDNFTGASAPDAGTTAYLQKVSSSDPGPTYLLNGLTGRAFTSAGTMSRLVGTGENTTIYSDEVWLTTTQGGQGFDIVNLRTAPPWRITESLDHPSTAGHWFKDKYFQARAGVVEVFDRDSRSLVEVISLGTGVSAIAFGTYMSTAAAPAPGAPGGGGGGGGGGIAPPPNPCGG